MNYPSLHSRCGRILGAAIGLAAGAVIDCSVQAQDVLPGGVSVRLELKNGKSDYLMGEPIDLRLIFSGDRPGYWVETVRMFGVSETIEVKPADQVFRWHGKVAGDVSEPAPLSRSGTSVNVQLNDAIILKTPGTYSVSVTTGRLLQGTRSNLKGLTVTTNPVTINVAPMSEEEEASRVAVLSKAIAKTDHDEGLDHATEVQLACLVGDRAAHKKVELFLTGRDDITGVRKTGLALSTNKALELELLGAAWRSLDRVPDESLLGEMILLRHLQAGIPVPDMIGMRAPRLSQEEVTHDLAERKPYVDEIVATMPRRGGANRSATQEFLVQENQYEESLAGRAR